MKFCTESHNPYPFDVHGCCIDVQKYRGKRDLPVALTFAERLSDMRDELESFFVQCVVDVQVASRKTQRVRRVKDRTFESKVNVRETYCLSVDCNKVYIIV